MPKFAVILFRKLSQEPRYSHPNKNNHLDHIKCHPQDSLARVTGLQVTRTTERKATATDPLGTVETAGLPITMTATRPA